MKMKDIIAAPPVMMKKKEKRQFIILGPHGNRFKEEEEDMEIEKFLCGRCKRKTPGKVFCSECGGSRKVMEESKKEENR
jgi:hypothetical protein